MKGTCAASSFSLTIFKTSSSACMQKSLPQRRRPRGEAGTLDVGHGSGMFDLRSLRPQRHKRIDLGRAARRYIRGEDGNRTQQQRNDDKGRRIGCRDTEQKT